MESKKMSHLAGEILRDPNVPELEKSLAGSVLSEADPARHPSAKMIDLATQISKDAAKYSKQTVSLANEILKLAK